MALINEETEFYTPKLPSFFVSRETNMSVSIEELQKEELEEIGKQWTEALLKKAGQ